MIDGVLAIGYAQQLFDNLSSGLDHAEDLGNNTIRFYWSNNTTTDVVLTGGSSVLQSDLTFTKDVGYVAKGTVYSTGTPIEDILRDMAYKELVGEAPTYYGYFDCDATGVAVTNPTVDDVKALNSEVVGTKEFSFYIDNMRYGQIVYAIPKSFGALTKIVVDSFFNYINSSCTKVDMIIDGVDYKVYFFTEPVGLENVLVECS